MARGNEIALALLLLSCCCCRAEDYGPLYTMIGGGFIASLVMGIVSTAYAAIRFQRWWFWLLAPVFILVWTAFFGIAFALYASRWRPVLFYALAGAACFFGLVALFKTTRVPRDNLYKVWFLSWFGDLGYVLVIAFWPICALTSLGIWLRVKRTKAEPPGPCE